MVTIGQINNRLQSDLHCSIVVISVIRIGYMDWLVIQLSYRVCDHIGYIGCDHIGYGHIDYDQLM